MTMDKSKIQKLLTQLWTHIKKELYGVDYIIPSETLDKIIYEKQQRQSLDELLKAQKYHSIDYTNSAYEPAFSTDVINDAKNTNTTILSSTPEHQVLPVEVLFNKIYLFMKLLASIFDSNEKQTREYINELITSDELDKFINTLALGKYFIEDLHLNEQEYVNMLQGTSVIMADMIGNEPYRALEFLLSIYNMVYYYNQAFPGHGYRDVYKILDMGYKYIKMAIDKHYIPAAILRDYAFSPEHPIFKKK